MLDSKCLLEAPLGPNIGSTCLPWLEKNYYFKKLMTNAFLQSYIKKYMEKFPNVFGVHFMSMNTPPRKGVDLTPM